MTSEPLSKRPDIPYFEVRDRSSAQYRLEIVGRAVVVVGPSRRFVGLQSVKLHSDASRGGGRWVFGVSVIVGGGGGGLCTESLGASSPSSLSSYRDSKVRQAWVFSQRMRR